MVTVIILRRIEVGRSEPVGMITMGWRSKGCSAKVVIVPSLGHAIVSAVAFAFVLLLLLVRLVAIIMRTSAVIVETTAAKATSACVIAKSTAAKATTAKA